MLIPTQNHLAFHTALFGTVAGAQGYCLSGLFIVDKNGFSSQPAAVALAILHSGLHSLTLYGLLHLTQGGKYHKTFCLLNAMRWVMIDSLAIYACRKFGMIGNFGTFIFGSVTAVSAVLSLKEAFNSRIPPHPFHLSDRFFRYLFPHSRGLSP